MVKYVRSLQGLTECPPNIWFYPFKVQHGIVLQQYLYYFGYTVYGQIAGLVLKLKTGDVEPHILPAQLSVVVLRLVVVHHKGADVVVKGRRRLKAALLLMLGDIGQDGRTLVASMISPVRNRFNGWSFFPFICSWGRHPVWTFGKCHVFLFLWGLGHLFCRGSKTWDRGCMSDVTATTWILKRLRPLGPWDWLRHVVARASNGIHKVHQFSASTREFLHCGSGKLNHFTSFYLKPNNEFQDVPGFLYFHIFSYWTYWDDNDSLMDGY